MYTFTDFFQELPSPAPTTPCHPQLLFPLSSDKMIVHGLQGTGNQSFRRTTNTAQNRGCWALEDSAETCRDSSLTLQLRKLRQKVSWGGCYLTPLHLLSSSLLSPSGPLSNRDLQSLLELRPARSLGVEQLLDGPARAQVPLPWQLRPGPTASLLAPVRAAFQKAQAAPRAQEGGVHCIFDFKTGKG